MANLRSRRLVVALGLAVVVAAAVAGVLVARHHAPTTPPAADAAPAVPAPPPSVASRSRALLDALDALAAQHPPPCDALEARVTELVGASKSALQAADAADASVAAHAHAVAVLDAIRPIVATCHLDLALAPADVVDPAVPSSPFADLVGMVVQVVAGDRGNCKAMHYDVDTLLATNRLTLDRESFRELPTPLAARVTAQLATIDADVRACKLDLSALRN